MILRDLHNVNNSAEQELEAYFNVRVEQEIAEEQCLNDEASVTPQPEEA